MYFNRITTNRHHLSSFVDVLIVPFFKRSRIILNIMEEKNFMMIHGKRDENGPWKIGKRGLRRTSPVATQVWRTVLSVSKTYCYNGLGCQSEYPHLSPIKSLLPVFRLGDPKTPSGYCLHNSMKIPLVISQPIF